ncbi:MAG: hypothetical protein Tsb0033_15990 [Winogradskyella sp.]
MKRIALIAFSIAHNVFKLLYYKKGLLFFLFFVNLTFSQELKSRSLDSTIPLFGISVENALERYLSENANSYNEVNYKSKIIVDEKQLEEKKANVVIKRTSNSSNTPWQSGSPNDMVDKYTLKPMPGDLSKGTPSIMEDLHNGKVNISIPLFEFEYYDYKIPISINNRYPQIIGETHGEPTAYVHNAGIGGGWTLSYKSYRVSRQVNGVEDEHPTKGYFSSVSQSKVNNPSSISNGDVQNGLKGDWDPAIDIFHYSTPTVSGSFLIDLNNNKYEILQGDKVHIEFQINNDKLNEFVITDGSGTKYYFGGSSNYIEETQSITDVFSFGRYKDENYNKQTIKYILEVVNNEVKTIATLPDNANAFAYTQLPGPVIPLSPNQIMSAIQQNNNSISTIIGYLGNLGGGYYDPQIGANRFYYAVCDYNASNNLTLLIDGAKYNDPEMRRQKVNSAWALKDIELVNGKKIHFLNGGSPRWYGYQTFGSNKIKIDLVTSGSDFTYQYQSSYGDFTAELNGIDVYNNFPQQLEFMKYPINETHTITTHFVKIVEPSIIQDEDNYSRVQLWGDHVDGGAPYIREAGFYSNAPSDIVSGASNPPGQISLIRFNKFNGSETTEIRLKNHTNYSLVQDTNDGQIYSVPWKDRSFLDEIVIDGRKKYSFDYEGSRLKRIHYPTGGTKEFFSTNLLTNSTKGFYNIRLNEINPSPGYLYGLHEAVVDKIVTTSENNITTEEFQYETPSRAFGAYSTKKTYRPDVAPYVASATMFSTSPVYNSHSTKSGTSFLNVEKYVNEELQFKSEYSPSVSTQNTLRLTNETTPDYLNIIGRPPTFEDEKKGHLIKNTVYKTNDDGTTDIEKETTFSRNFNPSIYEYPSIYLSKIEAGPWQNTSGAIKRGYSTYYYPFNYDIYEEQKIEKDYYQNGVFSTVDNTTFYETTKIPSIGLNNIRQIRTELLNNQNDLFETRFYSPIDILGLTSTNSSVNIDNTVFNSLLSSNRVPNIEVVSLNNSKLINSTSNKFKLTPPNNLGNSFAVADKEKILEIEDTNLDISDYNIQNVSSFNPNDIIFDNNLRDKIIYDRYDEDGRVLEYHYADSDLYTAVVWGYKKQRPVAVIQNARYSEVESFIPDIHFYSSQSALDSTLFTHLEALRNALPNAQVTSYTYKGGKVSTITDPKGDTIYYEYNDFNELKNIKDDDGHIIEEYVYNFKTLSNFTRNFSITNINWLNPRNYLNVGHNIFCEVTPTGGSGDYSYSWAFKSVDDGVILSSGNDQYSLIDLIGENYAGFILLEYEVTDNFTGVVLNESRQFYVNQYPEGMFTLNFENISENNTTNNGYFSSAQVTSPHTDTLRFWAFNMSTSGQVNVNINGTNHSLGIYETKIIEAPVNANQTINCSVTGSGNFNYVILEIFDPVNGTANPVNPKVLHLNNN